ncbi:MAG: hypothetical protein J7J96_01210 [Sulfurimonas sp.]|nr:hypothetical protein [Sulfurimonas sp.]
MLQLRLVARKIQIHMPTISEDKSSHPDSVKTNSTISTNINQKMIKYIN